MNDNTVLFIFDCNNTLVGHLHNYIGERLGGLIARNIYNIAFLAPMKNESKKKLGLSKNLL